MKEEAMRKALLITVLFSVGLFAQVVEELTVTDAGNLKGISITADGALWLGDDAGNVFKSGDMGMNWSKLTATPLAPTNGGAAVMSITGVDNGEAYVATSNSVFRFHTLGLSKDEVLTDGAAWFNKVEVMSNGDAWVFGDDPGDGNYDIRVTTDDGANWNSLATEPATGDGSWGWSNAVFKFDDDHMWFGTNSDDVFYTTDGGATWSVSDIPSGTYARSFAFATTTTGVAGTQDGTCLWTTDGGATWTAATTNPASGAGNRVYVGAIGVHDFIAAVGDKIILSNDGGDTWTVIHTETDGESYEYLAVDVAASGVYTAYAVASGGKLTKVSGIGSPEMVLDLTFNNMDLADSSAYNQTVVEVVDPDNSGGEFDASAPAEGAYSFDFENKEDMVDTANPGYLYIDADPNSAGTFSAPSYAYSIWIKPIKEEEPYTQIFVLNTGAGYWDVTHMFQAVSGRQFRWSIRNELNEQVQIFSPANFYEDSVWYNVRMEWNEGVVVVEILDLSGNTLWKTWDDTFEGQLPNPGIYRLHMGFTAYTNYNPDRFFNGEMDKVQYWKGAGLDLEKTASPVFVSGNSITFPEGVEYSFQALAEDKDEDVLSYTFSGLPAWLTDNGDGSVTGTATDPLETGTFTVTADDGTYQIHQEVSYAVGSGMLYVATDGDDGTGDGTMGAPYATIGKAFSEIAAGGHVILMPGRHEAPNDLSWPNVDVTLRGQTNAAECVIDGANQSASQLFKDLKSGGVVDSVRFVNCAAPAGADQWRVFLFNAPAMGAPFTVKNSVFDSCGSATSGQSPMFVGDNGAVDKVDIHHNLFTNGEGPIVGKNLRELRFNNNTVDNWTADQTFTDNVIQVYSYAQDLISAHIYNNIFMNCETKGGTNAIAKVWSEQDGRDVKLFSGCNLFYNNTATDTVEPWVKDGRAFSEVDQYYAAYNKNEDPGLTDPANGDYTIAAMGSAAVDGGYDVGYDFTGFFPDMGAIESDFVTPVELTTFEAKAGENAVTLSWATGSEVENRGFAIERRYEDGDFEKIGFVASAGATGANYSFVDQAASKAGVYTYRLKQIDLDGAFRYSRSVEVEVGTPNEFALDQNFPNPFNPSTTIRYELAQDVQVKLAVYNSIGEQIATLVNAQQAAGRYDVSFNASSFSSGIYFYRLEAGDFVDVKRMLLLK
ncbi:MAG: T9SS type A sorting domain-containing protein [Ignavibacteriales bacterium]|nr:T9SS type A sorting domain-containing protein [Ignavibacteriales bacterium]